MQIQYCVNFDADNYELLVYIKDIPHNPFGCQKHPFEIPLAEPLYTLSVVGLEDATPNGKSVNLKKALYNYWQRNWKH